MARLTSIRGCPQMREDSNAITLQCRSPGYVRVDPGLGTAIVLTQSAREAHSGITLGLPSMWAISFLDFDRGKPDIWRVRSISCKAFKLSFRDIRTRFDCLPPRMAQLN
jgi:hypothetical protein